jgi:hypothetical protein
MSMLFIVLQFYVSIILEVPLLYVYVLFIVPCGPKLANKNILFYSKYHISNVIKGF